MIINIKKVMVSFIYFFVFIAIICRMLSKITSQFNLLSYGALLMVVGLSILYFIFGIVIEGKIKINKFNTLLIIIIIYELVISLFNDSVYFPYTIIDIVTWPLLLIVFSNFTQKYNIPLFIKRRLFIHYLIIIFISIILISIHLSGRGNYGEIVFPVYYCVTFLPMILAYYKNENIKKISILVCILIIAASTKRTGTLATVGGVFLYLIIEAKISNSKNIKINKYIRLFLIIIISIFFLYIVADNISIGVLKRLSNISEDGGSGRNLIWNCVIENFNNSSICEKIFGHGYNSVYYKLKPLGFDRLAHNSYIEYLYDYGYFGVIFILIFFINIIKFSYKMMKQHSKNAPPLFYSIVVTLFFSIFSYFFEQSYIILPFAIFWGCCIGNSTRKEMKKCE